ncbi:MAG: hypothetical protein EBV96_03555 [Proteobacteria bacterium]|nr:hypothetical protein [Pseudomonadota bacterium]
MSLRVLLFSIICLLSFEQKIFAQIKLDGQFKNWTAQNTNINGQQVCYAVSSPIASDPKTLNRAESRIFVSFRANDKDTFSLNGFSDAYEAAKKKCNFSS